jgi:hypothetical protein
MRESARMLDGLGFSGALSEAIAPRSLIFSQTGRSQPLRNLTSASGKRRESGAVKPPNSTV